MPDASAVALPPPTQQEEAAPQPQVKPKAGPLTLDDIPDSTTASKPQPFLLTWPVVGSDGRESFFPLEVRPRYPLNDDGTPMDMWEFQIVYQNLAIKAQMPKVEKDGTQSYPDEGINHDYLREKTIESPAMLRDPEQFKKFKAKVPPYVISDLHTELLIAQGMNSAFFERVAKFANLLAVSPRSAASESASESPPQK